jgi:hypothetical protein
MFEGSEKLCFSHAWHFSNRSKLGFIGHKNKVFVGSQKFFEFLRISGHAKTTFLLFRKTCGFPSTCEKFFIFYGHKNEGFVSIENLRFSKVRKIKRFSSTLKVCFTLIYLIREFELHHDFLIPIDQGLLQPYL